MRSALAISLAIILASIATRLHLASADPGLNIPVTTGQGVTATIALSIEGSLGQFTVQQGGKTAVYTDGNYEVQVTEISYWTETKNRRQSCRRFVISTFLPSVLSCGGSYRNPRKVKRT